MLTIDHQGPYAYVSRPPTDSECNRYIGNGYRPPSLVNERNPNVYDYARGKRPPNYPVPAIPTRINYDWSSLHAGKLLAIEYWQRNRYGFRELREYWTNERYD